MNLFGVNIPQWVLDRSGSICVVMSLVFCSASR